MKPAAGRQSVSALRETLRAMTDVLRVALVVIGVVLALLAAWVVAPEAPIREAQRARAVVSRIFRRSRTINIRMDDAIGISEGTLTVKREVSWWPQDSVERSLEVLHDQVVDLRKELSTTDQKIRDDLGSRIDAVAIDVTTLANTVAEHWSEYQAAEERSSNLDASGFIPAAFGVILGAASEPLAAVTWIGVLFAVIGVGLVVRCVVVLRTHLGQRRTTATAAGTTATS